MYRCIEMRVYDKYMRCMFLLNMQKWMLNSFGLQTWDYVIINSFLRSLIFIFNEEEHEIIKFQKFLKIQYYLMSEVFIQMFYRDVLKIVFIFQKSNNESRMKLMRVSFLRSSLFKSPLFIRELYMLRICQNIFSSIGNSN